MSDVSLRDFQPINTWKVEEGGETYKCCSTHGEIPMYICDTIGRKYLKETNEIIQFKCFLLTLGTVFVHTVAAIVNVAYRIFKIVTLSHFWVKRDNETNYNFSDRALDMASDVVRIFGAIPGIVALELAAIYGIVRPKDGRKLYASLERGLYGTFILAPCFQPEPTKHALGGDINKKDQF